MKHLIKTLSRTKTGYGHFRVSIELDGKQYSTITTNSEAVDVAFDSNYDDNDNTGKWYESREEAETSLVNEILSANNIRLTDEL